MKNIFLFIWTIFPFLAFSQIITKKESVQSLYIEVYRDNIKLGSATAFIIKSKTQNYLVTNYHVVTNRNPINKAWLDPKDTISPNRIAIVHNAKKLGENLIKWEPLLDKKGNPLWHEDKINNEMVDVIELPLRDTTNITIYPVPYKSPLDTVLLARPTDRVFILGFPLGLRSSPVLPIWKSGLIASEPDIDQENKPIIWIDAITYPGMSGSPVYLITNELIDKHGTTNMYTGSISIFMGVFSHANQFNVYGALWKASYLKTIFDKLP